MNILVFDIETVPDIESGKRLYDLAGLGDEAAVQLMCNQRRQETDGKSEFMRHYLHQIVAISVVLKTPEQLKVWSLGEAGADEKEIIRRFFEGVERYSPILVSWNGGGFDLPVLHYRALLHGVSAPRYWEHGDEDRGFRWNNYLSRFHHRHTDLMDVLAGYVPQCKAPLDQLAKILGFPGKLGMDGGKVREAYHAGQIEAIRNYCETDVLNTYLIYLRYELIRGRLTEDAWRAECARLREVLGAENKPHLQEFLAAWPA